MAEALGGTSGRRGAAHTIASGLIGNVVEWYDWFTYGLLASVFASQIFPAKNPITSILAVFAAYAIGFLVRPLASILLSPYGDRHGRRGLMSLSIGMMGVAALLIAITPPYRAVGLLSPALLLLARVLQGVSAAGEFQSGASFILENASGRRRGLVSGLINTSSGASILLATVSSSLVTGLIHGEALATWGWRLPFVFGALLSLFGLYLRLRVPETPAFEALEARGAVAQTPVRTALTRYPLQCLQVAAVQFVGVPYYLWSVFVPTYAHLVSGIPLGTAFFGNTLGLLVYLCALPIVGALSDRFGRKRFLLISAAGLVVLIYPCFLLLQNPAFWAYLIANIVGWLLLSLIEALGPVVMVELLPADIRISGVGVPYQLSTAVLAGTAPLIASWFISIGHPIAIAFYVMGVMVVAGGIYLTLPETRGRSLAPAAPEPGADRPGLPAESRAG